MVTEKSLANLKPGAKPGERKGGRAKGVPNKNTADFRSIYDELDGKKRTVTRKVIAAQVLAATEPFCPHCKRAVDPRAGSDLLDRRFGRPSPSLIDAEGEQKEIVEYIVQRIR